MTNLFALAIALRYEHVALLHRRAVGGAQVCDEQKCECDWEKGERRQLVPLALPLASRRATNAVRHTRATLALLAVWQAGCREWPCAWLRQ